MKNRQIILGTLCAVSFSIFIVFALAPNAQDMPMAEAVDHKLKVLVFGNLTAEEHTEFQGYLFEFDLGKIIDHRNPPTNIADVDAFLFLMDRWSDVELLPEQESLGHFYNDVATTDPTSIAVKVRTTVNGGNPILFAFYNRDTVPNLPLSCFAREFLDTLENGESGTSFNLNNCQNSF